MNIRVIKDKNILGKHIRNNINIYFFAIILFSIGILSGIIIYNNFGDMGELTEHTHKIMENIISNDDNKVTINEVFKETLMQNIKTLLIFWLLGSSIIGLPILMAYVVYKGLVLGFTISTIIGIYGIWKGNLIVFGTLLIHNLISVPIIIFLFVSSIKLAENVLKRQKDIKIELIRHTIICGFLGVLLVIESIIESYFNTSILEYILLII